ncbi:alpha/beta hydrolase [Luteibacter aegosomatissinici]|uniref:alpha/beta hydrolase n=1 Tax=Luteibacter aegosomatissinici TaxID=2911539 RepID=UPI001FFB4F0D|nr:alpha/beta hydrolase [Luteibacter aegosomatissinici]UPG94669.1 alpha/beta hydrolase [Luteibacter aegosomatissinici]
MKPRYFDTLLILVTLTFSLEARADRPLSFPVPSVAWSACPDDTFADVDANVARIKSVLRTRLAERLQCARLRAPLDHYHPEGPKIDVGLIRVTALDAARREGSYFIHIGGPGGNPRDFIVAVGAKWALSDANDPIAGWQRKVSDRYDLVAVVPRGLEGGDTFQCRGIDAIEAPPDALSDWHATTATARDIAENCGANPAARWIGSEQHVFDLEQARRALGEPLLNFIGYSYGGLVGAWYRAMFPTTAGRLLLDSSIDFTGSIDDADLATSQERHREFQRRALHPLLRKHMLYRVANDETAIVRRLRAMPARARNTLLPLVQSASSLKAALVLADLLIERPWMTESEMHARITGVRFAMSGDVEAKVRKRVDALIGAYFGNDAKIIEALDAGEPDAETIHAPTWHTQTLGARESVFLATRCNDNPWDLPASHWQRVMQERSAAFPASRQGVEFFALICSQWPGRVAHRPALEPALATPPFLLIHAEHDVRTPLDGAARILEHFPAARLVVAKGVTGHGIVANSSTPCVEKAAGHYLLTGEVPEARLGSCPYVRKPRKARQHPDVASPGNVDELIERSLQDS